MLKSVSSIANAIGALNYKGTWDASTNTPDLPAETSMQKGDYYVVSVAGTTTLGGISTWYVGDWAVYNGSVWQRVEGGDDDPAPSVRSNSSTGVLQVTGPAAASTRVMTVPDADFTAARTDAAQSFTGDQTLATGNLVIGTSGKGIDFSAGPNAPGMTSELLDDYEEGDWTPALGIGGSITYTSQVGRYTKIGRQVTVYYSIVVATASGGAGAVQMNLPFACSGTHVDKQGYPGLIGLQTTSDAGITHTGFYDNSATVFFYGPGTILTGTEVLANDILTGSITYFAAA